jgi:hypothetical protein
MSFFNLAEYDYLEQSEPFYTSKTMICRKYSFQKLTQFSQENNVLDAELLTKMVLYQKIFVSGEVS